MRAILLILTWFLAFSASADELPVNAARLLKQAGVPQESVAVVAQRLDMPAPVLAINADKPMNPASVMKLLTTYAALEQLGINYRWRNAFYTAAPLNGDVLQGDMVLRGMGDPALTVERFWLLVRKLRDAGVREIQGDVLLDRSYFQASQNTADFDGQSDRAYNAAPDALLVNYKATRFDFRVQAGRVQISAFPAMSGLVIENRVEAVNGSCEGWKQRVTRRVELQGDAVRVAFSGRYPLSCGEQSLELSLLDTERYTGQLFARLWQESGGVLKGRVKTGVMPPQARLLASDDSLAMDEVVRLVNKYSNNVMARHLLLTLGAEQEGAPGDEQKGAWALKTWLKSKGYDYPELVIENGAGLSRQERVSAMHLAQVLQNAWFSPVMPAYLASLPVAGVDGTMKSRLKNTALSGRAYIKSGLLDGVRTMAGYVLDKDDRMWVVVFLVNHGRAAESRDAMDALLQWIYSPSP